MDYRKLPFLKTKGVLGRGWVPLVCLCYIYFLSALPFGDILSATVSNVYFYSPETNVDNFYSLKEQFDSYLSGHGLYRFQPFSDRGNFEEVIADKKDGVFLISSWHYQNLKDKLPLEPALVGSFKNQSTQKRVLSVKKTVRTLTALKGDKIASAGTEDYTRTVLKNMIGGGGEELVDSLRILVVPKDIDALIAVIFGTANGALATENSLRKLQEICPNQYDLLNNLASSEGTLLPIVAVPRASVPALQRLLAVIESMGDDRPEGLKRLRMIGLDRLRKLEDSEKRILLQ